MNQLKCTWLKATVLYFGNKGVQYGMAQCFERQQTEFRQIKY